MEIYEIPIENLQKLRKNSYKTQKEVAEELGWQSSKISKIEKGLQDPTLQDLKLLADYYGVSVEDLFKENVLVETNYNIKDELLRNAIKKSLEIVKKIKDEKWKVRAEISKEMKDDFAKLLPEALEQLVNSSRTYDIRSSQGSTYISEVMWSYIADKKITTDARKGIYVVYLFLADGSGVYLSLNQGFEYFNSNYDRRQKKVKAAEYARYIRQNYCKIPSHLQLDIIKLKGKTVRPRGYEATHIAGKFYSAENLPSEEVLIQDLKDLLKVYQEIVDTMDGYSIEEFYNLIDMKLHGYVTSGEEVTKAAEEIVNNLPPLDDLSNYRGKKKKKGKVRVGKGEGCLKYPRDPEVVAISLLLSNYKPFFESKETFISKKTGHTYLHVHHIIPLEYQDKFDFSLDVISNCVCLTVHQHYLLHHGTDEEREPMLHKLYMEYKELLKESGIGISYDNLKSLYGIE